jgi:hypothetical protein
MKKYILLLILTGFITSCSSNRGRVCGGPGGARCVENSHQNHVKSFKKNNC